MLRTVPRFANFWLRRNWTERAVQRFSGSSYGMIVACMYLRVYLESQIESGLKDRCALANWVLTPFKDRDFPFDLGFLIPLR